MQKQKKQYLGGRGSGQVKAGKGFRTAGFDRLRTPGVRGVLISCDVRSEGLCSRESMMAVREHCARRYPDLMKEADSEDEKEESSAAAVTNVEDAIAAEAAKEKEKVQTSPFGMIETKTKGLLFVEFHDDKMDPVEICADYVVKGSCRYRQEHKGSYVNSINTNWKAKLKTFDNFT